MIATTFLLNNPQIIAFVLGLMIFGSSFRDKGDKMEIKTIKELHNKIYACKCKAVTEGYCSHCECSVLEFMNKYGSGTLMQDIKVEELEKENKCLLNEITRLDNLRYKLATKLKALKKGQ